jgi:threonyl-tRNA synthetase
VPADKLHITLAGREQVVEAGTTAASALDGQPAIAARVNHVLRDLAVPLADGDAVEAVTADSPDGLAILRHSTTHVMAQAVQELFPAARLGIGPPVENGFYYDFDVPEAFGPDDLKAIEARMRQIVKQGQRFERRVVTDDQARAELAGEPYKLELIDIKGGAAPEGHGGTGGASPQIEPEELVEVGGAELTIYDNVDPKTGARCWKDLCRGPHLPTTRQIPAFKLMRSGGAYRLAVTRRTGRLPADALRSGEARPPQAGRRAGPVLLPDRDRQRPARVSPQGRDHPAGHGGLLAPPP